MKAVDLFAGLGGWTEGARAAGVSVVWAANHWKEAVHFHRANHPTTHHECQDLRQADWSALPPHNLLIASPSCKGTTPARGKEKPHHEAERSTAWAVVDCAECHREDVVIVENVPAFPRWILFPAWRSAMEALGYTLAVHVVDAADHGVPQNRVRVFIICTRSRHPLWLTLPRLSHVPFSRILAADRHWSPVRTKCERTRARVRAGRRQFGDRFLVPYYGSARGGRSLDRVAPAARRPRRQHGRVARRVPRPRAARPIDPEWSQIMSGAADIIEKIKKLLRLARSSNPHEAQLAMQRALELAREHEIAIEGLNPDECAKEKAVTHRDTEEHLRISYDKEYAVRICCRFFHVDAVFVRVIVRRRDWPELGTKITFVGRRADLEIAFYVYHFLLHHFSFAWRRHRGRLRNRHAFIDGMFRGIYSKLADAEPPRDATGLELVMREREDYITAHLGETTKGKFGEPDHNAHAALNAGWVAGRATNIRTPINPANEILALQ